MAWRAARQLFEFHEIKGTCLGYGGASISGSGLGSTLINRVLKTAKEIVDLGVTDPDLFILLPLLEENVGPDRISDITTKTILPDLARFTQRVLSKFSINKKPFLLNGESFLLPENPFEKVSTPVILVPRDILRDLPLATDWSDVGEAASKNSEIRAKVNTFIGEIWKARVRKDKDKLRARVLESKNAFDSLLESVHVAELEGYDFESDSEGVVQWREVHENVAQKYPLALFAPPALTVNSVADIVKKIVDQFSHLIENRDLWKLLWGNDRAKHEKTAQLIFFAVADAYCAANNLEITPEADTGNGPVDFKFSGGYDSRLLVEIKLSKNPKLIAGYEKQLESYKKGEKADFALYVVIDVDNDPKKTEKKFKKLLDIKNKWAGEGYKGSEIIFIDGNKKLSASKK